MGGESPISYQAMSQFARDHGLTIDEFDEFRRLVGILDAVHLDRQAEIQRLQKETSS